MVADLARRDADHRPDSSKILRAARVSVHASFASFSKMTESPGGLAGSRGPIEALYDEVRRATEHATKAPPPTPTAACVLWRSSHPAAPAIEVFLVQRALSDPFLGGTWGFPGGPVEPADPDSIAV